MAVTRRRPARDPSAGGSRDRGGSSTRGYVRDGDAKENGITAAPADPSVDTAPVSTASSAPPDKSLRDSADSTPSAAMKRVAALLVGAVATGMMMAAVDTVLPLLSTATYGFDKSDYSFLLACKMIATGVAVLAMQPLTLALGPHKAVMWALLMSGPMVAWYGYLPQAAFVIFVSVAGAIQSTTFVNLNTLTQTAYPQRAAAINTLYRAFAKAPGVVLPLIVTRTASVAADGSHDYGPAFAITGAMLLLAGVAFAAIGGEGIRVGPSATRTLGTTARDGTGDAGDAEPAARTTCCRGSQRNVAGAGGRGIWMPLLRHRPLVTFLVVAMAAQGFANVMPTFIAHRVTDASEIGASEEFFGAASSISATVSLASIMVTGVVMGYASLRTTLAGLYAVKAVALLAAGVSDNAYVAAGSMIAYRAASSAFSAPMSMWVGRECATVAGGASMSAAFVLLKLLSASFKFVSNASLVPLAHMVSLRTLFLTGALGIAPIAIVQALLVEPPALAPSRGAAVTAGRRKTL